MTDLPEIAKLRQIDKLIEKLNDIQRYRHPHLRIDKVRYASYRPYKPAVGSDGFSMPEGWDSDEEVDALFLVAVAEVLERQVKEIAATVRAKLHARREAQRVVAKGEYDRLLGEALL